MKNILNSKEEKITDKAFKQSITISIIGILLCMVALCSVTWAWYSKNISSDSNTVYAANCDMSISVQRIDGEDYFDVEKSDGRYQLKNLEKAVEYKISLKAVGSANSAYAIIKYKGDLYYTDQFEVFSDSSTAEEFTFILSFSEENISIQVYPCWGTSSRVIRDVYNGESYSNLQKTQKTAQTTQVLTTTQAPRTAQTPVTTAPVTTETPVTTAPMTTETPVTTAPVTTETSVTTAPMTIETPVTTAPVTTETPVTTAPMTIETPVTTAPVTTETLITTAPVTTETPVTTTSQITATPQNSAPETTWAAETEKVLPEAEQIVE